MYDTENGTTPMKSCFLKWILEAFDKRYECIVYSHNGKYNKLLSILNFYLRRTFR